MNVDKTFLETHRVEEMREIINKMTQEIDSKVDNQKLIDSVDDYNKFMKDSSQKANKTLEETAEEMKIKKAINKLMADAIINRLEDSKELSDEKIKEETDNLIKGNNITGLSKEQLEEVQALAKKQIKDMYEVELESRKEQLEGGFKYEANTATKEEKEKVNELRDKDLQDLTISELKTLKKNRVKSYIEQDRILQNMKLYNTANANLGKKGISQSELAEHFFNKKKEEKLKENKKPKNKVFKLFRSAEEKKAKIEKIRTRMAREAANTANSWNTKNNTNNNNNNSNGGNNNP
jgi:hypothetical protein